MSPSNIDASLGSVHASIGASALLEQLHRTDQGRKSRRQKAGGDVMEGKLGTMAPKYEAERNVRVAWSRVHESAGVSRRSAF